MLFAISVLSFIFGIVATITWGVNENGSRKTPTWLPHALSVIFKRLRRGIYPDDSGEKATLDNPENSRIQNETSLLTKFQVEILFDASSWQRLAYEDFKTTILAKGTGLKTFPCVYATMGYRSNDHRYLFLKSDDPSEPQNVRLIGPALESYLDMARSLGPNTSLVIMAAPSDSLKTVGHYNRCFWDMLRGLRIHDPRSWPNEVPSKTQSEKWTFCYNGEPVFPVLLTPAHIKRYSRHMPVPVIALQPKWILDQLLSTPERRESATSKVRKLLKDYDSIDISPDLTSYGEPGTCESRQLCLDDANDSVDCPYEDFDR